METKKNQFTVNQLHEKFIKDDYEVKRNKAKEWIHLERNQLKESYLGIFHEPPRQLVQFDWGTKRITVNSKYRTVCFAVFAFPYSNYRYIHVTEKMNGRSFVDAFTTFTKHIDGVYPILLIDNMKISVQHKSYRDQQTKLTTLLQQLEEHYNIEIRPCTPFRPNQKGSVENAVKTLKTHLFAYQSDFVSLKELQAKVQTTFQQLNNQKHHEKTTPL